MVFIQFAFGFMSPLRINVGYVYLMELMPAKVQTTVTSLWSAMETTIYIIATIYYWKISKQWIWFSLIGFVWNIISAALTFWVPESPRFLLSIGKTDEAKVSLEKIASWNRKELLNWELNFFVRDKDRRKSP